MPLCLSELSRTECAALLNGLAITSRIFWGPEPDICAQMLAGDYIQDLTDLAGLLGEDQGQAPRNMAAWLAKYQDANQLYLDLERDFVPLFVNRPQGVPAPLYQSCYEDGPGLLMGRAAQTMGQRLAAAGIGEAGLGGHPPDHLAVELEYLFFLLERAFGEDDPSLLAEARKFAGGELLPWLAKLRKRLAPQSPSLFYPAAADLTLSLVGLAAS